VTVTPLSGPPRSDDAKLVALDVVHDRPESVRPVDPLRDGGARLLQAGGPGFDPGPAVGVGEAPGDLDVQVEAVLAGGLGLRDLIAEDGRPVGGPDTGGGASGPAQPPAEYVPARLLSDVDTDRDSRTGSA
jgi:hypothetical protein